MSENGDTPAASLPPNLDAITGGATPAPTDNNLVENTPVTTSVDPVEGDSSSSDSEQNEWDNLLDDISREDSGETTVVEVEPVEQVARPTVPAEKTPQLPAGEAATAPVPQQQPEPQQQPQEQQAPQQPQQSTPTSEQVAEYNRQLLANFENSLVAGYQITNPEDVRNLQINPETVLPSLAAKIHSRIFTQVISSVGQMFQQNLPKMVQEYMTTEQNTRSSTEEFYSDWEELKNYGPSVDYAQKFMQSDPNSQRLSRKDYLTKLGQTAWLHAGLGANTLVVKMANKETSQRAPGQEVLPPGTPLPPIGLTPGNPGRGGAMPQPKTPPSNEFERWAEEIISSGEM